MIMKKIFIFGFIALCMSAMFSCSSCKNDNNVEPEDTTQVVSLVAENCISTDREDMFLNYGEDYRWYETSITLDNYLDDECASSVFYNLTDVFQFVSDKGNSSDCRVVFYTYTSDSYEKNVVDGIYVGDFPLNDAEINLTFEEAYERVMEANLPKPHSRKVVLRKEVGPKPCNPQYIFGNTKAQIYVDATTGDVTDKNPAFPEEDGFKMPLGEWP